MYEERIYRRDYITGDLKSFEVMVKESDLYICASSDLSSEAIASTLKYRAQIEEYIQRHPEFISSLTPLRFDILAAPIVKEMLVASAAAGTGPMASVAGAIAEYVGRDLLKFSQEVIVENGGDIFIKSSKNRRLGIYAGSSPLSEKITFEIEAGKTPAGICTSSGTVGPSLSFGRADAALIVASSAALADACATAVGNIVKEPGDIKKALEFAQKIKGLRGVMIIMKDKLGAWGEIKIV